MSHGHLCDSDMIDKVNGPDLFTNHPSPSASSGRPTTPCSSEAPLHQLMVRATYHIRVLMDGGATSVQASAGKDVNVLPPSALLTRSTGGCAELRVHRGVQQEPPLIQDLQQNAPLSFLRNRGNLSEVSNPPHRSIDIPLEDHTVRRGGQTLEMFLRLLLEASHGAPWGEMGGPHPDNVSTVCGGSQPKPSPFFRGHPARKAPYVRVVHQPRAAPHRCMPMCNQRPLTLLLNCPTLDTPLIFLQQDQ